MLFLCFYPIDACAAARLIVGLPSPRGSDANGVLLFGHNSIFSLIFVAAGLRDRKEIHALRESP
jgi:hypothetical protein